MGFKERFFRSDNLGVIKRNTYSPSGDIPLPLALHRAKELKERSRIKQLIGKLRQGR